MTEVTSFANISLLLPLQLYCLLLRRNVYMPTLFKANVVLPFSLRGYHFFSGKIKIPKESAGAEILPMVHFWKFWVGRLFVQAQKARAMQAKIVNFMYW